MAKAVFGPQEFRDLQVLSQVAWFDEEFQEHDPEVRALVEKGRNFNLEDQALMGRKQREICARVIPEYRKLAESGQIEISTTPFYHPILPLLCDSDIASVSHPHVPLPPRFCYPEDARLQLEMARDYVKKTFGVAPVGLWPSEGSVSDHVLELAAAVGFEWAATDNGVLDRTLRRAATPEVTYRPYRWAQRDRQMRMIFRDHVLSDLIGFVYSGMGAADAAQDFLQSNSRQLQGFAGERPRRAGADHPRRRERLGVLRPQRPAVLPRVVRPHSGRSATWRRSRFAKRSSEFHRSR